MGGIADGTIQCVGSDLAPTTLAMKGDDIWNAPMGLGNTSELLLPVVLSEGVNKGRISLEQVAEICALNPARVFGISPRKAGSQSGRTRISLSLTWIRSYGEDAKPAQYV